MGRNTIITDKLKETVSQCISSSLSVSGTCRVAGISSSAWYQWKLWSEAYQKKTKKQKEKDLIGKECYDFFQVVEEALGKAELKLILDIQKEATAETKLKVLRRRFHDDWGEITTVENKDLDIDKKIESQEKISKKEMESFKKLFNDDF